MMKKLKLAVLMGGLSSEREVSFNSGKQVLKNLDIEKYEIFEFSFSKQNEIPLVIEKIIKNKIDLVFIALHGGVGENGSIQGLFDTLGIKYTGGGVLSSAIGMDKIAFNKVMQAEKLPMATNFVVDASNTEKITSLKIPSFPVVVKPSSEGSSVGISIVDSKKDLSKAVKASLKFGNKVILEKYLYGKEVTCAVMGNSKPYALPVIEIIPKKNSFFDYNSKYMVGGSDEIVPARISAEITKKIQEIAIKVYKAIKCEVYARVDLILVNNKSPFVLEINTLPGLTKTSLLPKAANAHGMNFTQLLDKIVELSLKKYD